MQYNESDILSYFNNSYLRPDDPFAYEEMESFIDTVHIPYTYLINYGASKMVFIPLEKDKKYVIKIPFNGEYYEAENGECLFDRFCHSDNLIRPWDYCATEAERYKIAKKYNLEEALAQTCYVGKTQNGYPIYIQEKCAICSELFQDNKYNPDELITTTKSYPKNFDILLDTVWATDFRLFYGQEFFQKFITFLFEHQWRDLSENNIGYINDRPVLVDYSDYNG